MSAGKLDTLTIYDWNQTVNDVKKQGSILARNFPSFFSQEIQEQAMKAKVTGIWQKWELTDEGSGQYPIYKCSIEDGTLEVEVENKKTKYDLKNSWIKICAKIEIDKSSSTDMYKFSEQEDALYSIHHSFPFDKENRVASNLLEHLLVSWFKEHRNLLNNHVNNYRIHVRTSNDLTLAGWDTGYVTSFSNVNKTILEKKLYPENFTYKFEDDSMGFPLLFNMKGTFDSWEITTGADGQNVNFILKIGENSTFTNETGNTTFDFSSDAFLKVQVKLEYFNSTEKTIEDPTGLHDGNQVELRVKTDRDQNQNPPVVLVDSYYSEDLTSPLLNSIATSMFKEWLNENIDKFENIFSYFLLHETAKNEDFQWLKPTTAYYGVASVEDENKKPDLDKSVFSVMSMVENHVNKFPQHTVDARLLHAVNNESAFGIDMPLFVEKWLEKALITMQVGTLDQFERTDNGKVIKNKERIKFATIEDEGWEGAEAYIEKGNFSLGIINNQLVLEMTDVNWKKSGRVAHVDYKQAFDLQLKSGTDSSGKRYENVLMPIENSEPTYRVTFTKEDWKFWMDLCIELVIGIGLGIAFGAIGKIGGKALDKLVKGTKQVAQETGENVMISSNAQGALNRPFSQFLTTTFIEEGGAANLRPLISSASQEIASAPTTSSGLITVTPGFMSNLLQRGKIFAGKLWENKFKLTGGLVLGAVGGVTPMLVVEAINHIEEEKFGSLPTIENFVANCVGTVKWPDNSEFKIETAQLQGIYLMGGKLNKEK